MLVRIDIDQVRAIRQREAGKRAAGRRQIPAYRLCQILRAPAARRGRVPELIQMLIGVDINDMRAIRQREAGKSAAGGRRIPTYRGREVFGAPVASGGRVPELIQMLVSIDIDQVRTIGQREA